jgi:hypothetical protein
MKHLLIGILAGPGLLLMSLTLSAQDNTRPEYRDQVEQSHLFQRLRIDLDRASANTVPFTADRYKVVHAQDEVNRSQGEVATGDYDRTQIDDTVAALQQVADIERLSDLNRGYLLGDVGELRQMQSQLERRY